MGPIFWGPQSPSKLKKCSERKTDSCDPTETDGCCGVIPCTYCLTWEPYQADTEYGVASFSMSSWIGAIAGASFLAFWEVGYDSGECEFVVELDGEEIFREPCYGTITCRDSSGSADGTIDYVDGTLTWEKREPRPLEYIADPDDPGCNTWFCGQCECTCDCLCVTIVEYGGGTSTGEICDVSYPCDAPSWEGTVGGYLLSLQLSRDVYGECIITPTVDGEELDSVAADGCGSLSATIELSDGTVITVKCKECNCEPLQDHCCPDLVIWPTTLTIEISDPDGCFNLTGTLNEISPSTHTYGGTVTGSCTPACSGITSNFSMEVLLSCSANDGWLVEFELDTPADDCGALPPDAVLTQISCDPIYLAGDMDCFSCPTMICPGVPPGLPYPYPSICASVIVYE